MKLTSLGLGGAADGDGERSAEGEVVEGVSGAADSGNGTQRSRPVLFRTGEGDALTKLRMCFLQNAPELWHRLDTRGGARRAMTRFDATEGTIDTRSTSCGE